jgi:hypothetical protein
MDINIDDVICIDLMPYTVLEIQELCEFFNLDPDSTIFNKENGVKKVYLIPDQMIEVATEIKDKSPFSKTYCTYNGLKTEFPLSRRQIKQLKNLKPFDFRKFKKQQRQEAHKNRISQNSKPLDLDTILDKISIQGLNSLTQKEKDFLNGLEK